MQIGPANAHSLDPDLHFARSRIFNRHVGQPECQGSDEFRSSHRMLFLRNDTSSVGGNKRRADGCPSGAFRVCGRLSSPNLVTGGQNGSSARLVGR